MLYHLLFLIYILKRSILPQNVRTLFNYYIYDINIYFTYSARGYWANNQNLRKFFDKFAQDNQFDPLIPDNWYPITRRQIILAGVSFPFLSLSYLYFTYYHSFLSNYREEKALDQQGSHTEKQLKLLILKLIFNFLSGITSLLLIRR